MPATRAWGNGSAKHVPNGKPASRKAQPAKDVFDLPESDDDAPPARASKPAARTAKSRAPAKTQKPALAKEPPTRAPKSQPAETDVFDFPASDDEKPPAKPLAKRAPKVASAPKARRVATPATEESDASRKRKRPEPPPKKPAAKDVALRPTVQKEPPAKTARNHAKQPSPPPKVAVKPRVRKTTPVLREPATQSGPMLADLDAEDYRTNDRLRTPSPTRTGLADTEANGPSITPRQAVMWSKLLDHTNKALLRNDAATERRRGALSPAPQSSNAAGDRKTKRVRLVDALKTEKNYVPKPESSSEEEESSEEDVNGAEAMNSQSSALPQSQPMNTRTYGRERTFMEESNEDDMFETLMDDVDDAKPGSQQQDLDPIDEEEESGQPKSMHDLRAAGSKKRLVHELESLISGIKGEGFDSAGAKRADLLELTKKLLDPTTSQFFLDHGLEKGLVACLAKSTDSMFDFIGALALNCLLKTITSLSAVRHVWSSGCLARLLGLLDLDLDIARTVKERRFNLSRVAQAAIAEMKPAIMQAEIWADPVPARLSPRIVALTSIERLIRKTRELGNADVLADEATIARLVESQKWEGAGASSPDHALEVELTISALESSSVGISPRDHAGAWPASSLRRLAARLPAILLSSDAALARARNLALRLALNVTNNNRAACDEFAAQGFVAPLAALVVRDFARLDGDGHDEEAVFDELILSLGAVINLAELSDAARERMLDDDGKALMQAVALFQAGLDKTEEAESVEASRTNVPYGYLALLLVNLCQNARVRALVLGRLRGGQLSALVAAAEEFIAINQQTDRELLAGGGGGADGGVQESYTRRLLGMVDRLKVLAEHGS